MTTEMSAGLEVELGPLHLAIGKLTSEIEEMRKQQKHVQDFRLAVGSGVCPTPTATFSFPLGQPMAGYFWRVRSIMVGGGDITITPTGVAWISVMANQPNATPPLFTIKDFTKAALPQVAFYGNNELIVTEQNVLWVVITAGTAGVEYVGAAQVENFHEFDKSRI